ncbi:MAG: hypothetical protein HY832_02170 [Candidatus Aenigmarchaeota archaeon]|nr:hypothetical protein [Candidatus Aenigmarchaeota archaeon]
MPITRRSFCKTVLLTVVGLPYGKLFSDAYPLRELHETTINKELQNYGPWVEAFIRSDYRKRNNVEPVSLLRTIGPSPTYFQEESRSLLVPSYYATNVSPVLEKNMIRSLHQGIGAFLASPSSPIRTLAYRGPCDQAIINQLPVVVPELAQESVNSGILPDDLIDELETMRYQKAPLFGNLIEKTRLIRTMGEECVDPVEERKYIHTAEKTWDGYRWHIWKTNHFTIRGKIGYY